MTLIRSNPNVQPYSIAAYHAPTAAYPIASEGAAYGTDQPNFSKIRRYHKKQMRSAHRFIKFQHKHPEAAQNIYQFRQNHPHKANRFIRLANHHPNLARHIYQQHQPEPTLWQKFMDWLF